MAPERAAAYIGGGVLLAAWLASAAGVTQPRVVRAPRAAPEAIHLDALASEVQSQASRLRQRLANAPAPRPPLRNPFVFASRIVPARAPMARAPVAEPPETMAVPEAPEPDLVLLGIAQQGAARTAMIGAGDELLMVTIGQDVGGRYRVSTVGADAVELKDLATGATRRLALKPPASLP